MFQARSISRSPAERCLASSEPRFSGVIRRRTKRTPWAVQGCSSLRAVLEIQDRDVLQRDAEVLDEDRQRALGHRPVAQHQIASEVDHDRSL